MTTQPHRLAQLCRHGLPAAPGTFPGPTVRIPQVKWSSLPARSPQKLLGKLGRWETWGKSFIHGTRSKAPSPNQSEPRALTLIFLKNRDLFLLQTEKETAAQSGSTQWEKQQRDDDLIRAVPPNLHASPCLQGQEIPEPPLGTGWPSLPLLDSLWDNKAEKLGCFLAWKTHFRATTSFHRGEIKPSGVQSVSQCICLYKVRTKHKPT